VPEETKLTRYSHGAGCACKLGSEELTEVLRHVRFDSGDPALLVGLDSLDDAAVYRITDDVALVQTVDFFTPIVDDPFDWGRIAAANAISDVYAMGGRPLSGLNLVAWPRSLDFALLGRVLEGGAKVCAEAGVTVVGGHSVDDPEPKFGLAVTGTIHPDRIVTNRGAEAGMKLVLTKPLGTGIVSTAVKQDRAQEAWVTQAVESMATLNRAASEAMLEVGGGAATDITGFGLVGHLLEMLGEGQGAEIDVAAVPLLAGAAELAAEGVFPGGSARNLEAGRPHVDSSAVDLEKAKVLFDAQTSGGLLIAVAPGKAAELVALLERKGVPSAAIIGEVVDASGDSSVVLR
jgi:selenide, water dikinase